MPTTTTAYVPIYLDAVNDVGVCYFQLQTPTVIRIQSHVGYMSYMSSLLLYFNLSN